MNKLKRRHFLMGSLAASAVAASAKGTRKVAPSDRVTLSMIGVGGRGNDLLRHLAKRSDVEIAYLCDVDASRFARPLETLESEGRPEPGLEKDFRRILDKPDIDAVVIATPLQWQALATIMSCQAGKDVYVEKPGSHNAWEAKMVFEAARKYDRVVQVGMQNRSATYVQNAIKYVHSGKLGNVHLVRVVEMIRGGEAPGGKGPAQEAPSHLDWDLWCGPAPMPEYSPGRWWFDRYDYAVGRIFDDAHHQLDVARAMIGQPFPKTVYCTGGLHVAKDGRDIPDTQTVTFEFEDLILLIQGTLWANYMHKTPTSIRDSDQFPDWRFNATQVELFGSQAMMSFGRMGGGWQVHDLKGDQVAFEYGRQATAEHIENFLDCVRTRERPNGDIEEGYFSVLLCHLANASYRAGQIKLEYDPKKVEFVGNPEASRLLRREKYRKPWVLPDKV